MSKYQSNFLDYRKTNYLTLLIIRLARYLANHVDNPRYRKISNSYNFNGFKRIYFIHIRKTAGTSLNHMFLSLADPNSHGLYKQISSSLQKRIEKNGKIFVGHNRVLINRGNYFYAYSHTPIYKLKLPPKTFTITCLRDPVRRVISLYNMLSEIKRMAPSHPLAKTEGKWLGRCFEEFLNLAPKADLLNQLYMFSENFDVAEAITEVKKVNHIIFSEEFADGITSLNEKTGLHLKPIHARKTEYKEMLPKETIKKLELTLEPEYEFIKLVKRHLGQK